MTQSREIRLKSRPVGTPTAANFDIATVDVGAPGSGQVLVCTIVSIVGLQVRSGVRG